jgi:biopolymer transport protein ExbD
MYILPSSYKIGKSRAIVLTVIAVMTLAGFIPLIFAATPAIAGEENTFQPDELKIGQRSGDHYFEDNPPEYLAEGSVSGGYFGATMDKLDFNGDGFEDLAISAPMAGSGKVYIYDGSTQLKFPDLGVTGEDARWTLSGGSQAFGTDFAMGDVNGDGVDDILVAGRGGNSAVGELFYGGTYLNSPTMSDLSSNASFSSEQYGYYGPWAGLGDLDGDGYDEVISGCGGYTYQWGGSGSKYYYGEANWWFSEGPVEFVGSYSHQDADGHLDPFRTHGYSYSWGSYDYHYAGTGMGGVATGDMNGDGRDEIALGNTYRYHNNQNYAGSVSVMYPGESIRNFTTGELLEENDHMDWVDYRGQNYMDAIGGDPQIIDYNKDGLGDLFFSSGFYSYGSYYQDNGKYLWVIEGDTTIPTGEKRIRDSSSYDKRFYADGSKAFGTRAFGDYNGDGDIDIAFGDSEQDAVYVVLYDDYASKTGDIEVTALSSFTVHAPKSSSQYFAHPTEYYRYYYQGYGSKFRTVCFMNRDNDGLDDLFVADPGGGYMKGSGPGIVYGVSNYNMFGIGIFESSGADAPDGRTYYAEYNSYKFKGSAWNKWSIWGPELEWDFIVGQYSGTVRYTNPGLSQTTGQVEVINDPYNIIRVDPTSLVLDPDEPNSTLYVSFNVFFTLDLPAEADLDVFFHAKADHIQYDQYIEGLGAVKNRFRWYGDLEGYWQKGSGESREEDWIPFKDNSWVPEDSELKFTGVRMIYNGTQDFDEPFYPESKFFNVTLESSLGDTDVDPDSSGRDFEVQAPGGDRPISVQYFIDQEGIPKELVLNEVPTYTARVDIDTPTAPPGVQVHADGFDDMNTIVDNDQELYVTWHEPGEFNSGVDHYEVECDGVIYETDTTFTKVMTTEVGEVEVNVRAIDRVAHVGPWASATIYIDDKMMDFTGFTPVEGTWLNTLTPQVEITITDLGGRAMKGPSVEFTVSRDGGNTWGEWISADMELNAKSINVAVTPNLIEGTMNMIMFRAADEAGNIMTSDTYNLSVDVSGVTFESLMVDGSDDWESTWLPESMVDLKLHMSDDLSGVDGTTLQYRYSTRGRADLNSAVWNPLNIQSGTDVDAMISDLDLAMGDRNYIQFRAHDSVGNPYSYSEAYNIWINTMPEIGMMSPVEGSEYMEDESITFDATGTMDIDMDALTFTWTDTVVYNGETTTGEIGVGKADPSRFQQKLSPGEHSLTLTVSDGVHEIVSEPIEFTVLERIIPVWLSSEDADDDGMPNYWEYTYFLGWDNPANKDNLFNPSTMSGKTRSALYEELTDQFAGEASAATQSNDADRDGHTDFEEYLAGTDPTDALQFPVYKMAGEEASEEQAVLIPILVAVCLVVIIVMIVVVAVTNASIKRDLEAARVKDAEEEKQLMENALSSGGKERLDNLLAAAKGEATALPSASPQMAQALPMAEPQAQPMDAQPMAAQPMDAQPMQAAPLGQPDQTMGGPQQ